MSGKLEEYLRKERSSLDVETPDDEFLWKRIETRLSAKPANSGTLSGRIGWIRIRNIAAAGFIMFCLGYITKDIISTLGSRQNVTLSSIDSHLGQREDQYRKMVSLKYEDVKNYRDTGNQVVKELFSEIERLDTIYMQSMTDLKVLGPNEKVINTIFDTYESRIRLLELIILETNRTKIHENNEKIRL